jgi:hypothetical protein
VQNCSGGRERADTGGAQAGLVLGPAAAAGGPVGHAVGHVRIGYARACTARQLLDMQTSALTAAGARRS